MEPFSKSRSFWKNHKYWTLMGDLLGREPAMTLLHPKHSETLIDAGCGEGEFTRRIARSENVKVIACDRSEAMLQLAMTQEHKAPLGISYVYVDISKQLPCAGGRADAVYCVAVLQYDTPAECADFFQEAQRVLRPGGRLIVSITHPFLYQPEAPTRNGTAKWLQVEPVVRYPSMDISCIFKQRYMNTHGQIFTSQVWYHPEYLLPQLIEDAGLEVVKRQHTFVRQQHISNSRLWAGSPYDHPAYYQLLAVKP